MSTSTETVTIQKAERVLALVAEWLGEKGYGTLTCTKGRALHSTLVHADDGSDCPDLKNGPAPTGPDAASNGTGPMLTMDWDWPDDSTPTVLLEGGPYDWALDCCFDVQRKANAEHLGVFLEPYAGYALCIYPD